MTFQEHDCHGRAVCAEPPAMHFLHQNKGSAHRRASANFRSDTLESSWERTMHLRARAAKWNLKVADCLRDQKKKL